MQKRKKSVLVVLVVAILTLAIQAQVFGLEFNDVNINASYHKAVDVLSNHGIIQGRGDGVFAPKDNITRAEFCAVLARANGYSASYYTPIELPFSDVEPDFWAVPYISYCYENGYISGMPDGTFCPNDYVTDEQAIKMVVCSSGIGDESLSKIGPKWYSGYVNKAHKYEILEDVTVRTNSSSNRAFVAQIVYNATLRKADSKTVEDALNEKHAIDFDDSTSDKDSKDVMDSIKKDANAKPEISAKDKAQAESDAKAYEKKESEAKKEAEEKASDKKAKKEEQARKEAEERAKKEAEEKKKAEEEAKRKEAEEKAKKEAEEKAEKEAKSKRNSKISTAKKDGKTIIVLDAGHNYSVTDTGAVGNGLREQDITFYIASKAKPLLEKNGFTVIMTREKLTDNVSEVSVGASLNERTVIANEAGAALFISIHCNAGGGTGTETYYCTGSDTGQVLAEYIHEAVMDEVGLTDRGVKDATFYVLRNTDMPATLLETAFIDRASDAKILGDEKYQEAYAVGIAKGVCNYFGVKYKD